MAGSTRCIDWSSGASDSEGSLKNFIVHEDDTRTFTPPTTLAENRDDGPALTLAQCVAELVDEFPYDRKLLKERVKGAVRKSRRLRKAPVRYVDANYAKLMFESAEEKAVVAEVAADKHVDASDTRDDNDSDFLADDEDTSDDDEANDDTSSAS
jgi:hypothetical protein